MGIMNRCRARIDFVFNIFRFFFILSNFFVIYEEKNPAQIIKKYTHVRVDDVDGDGGGSLAYTTIENTIM